MNILFCINENYSDYALLSMYAILKNNKGSNFINFYIIHDGLQQATKEKMKVALERYESKYSVTFIPIEKSLFDGLPIIISHLTSIIYARLFLFKLYPWGNVDRLIYLDVDILINGDLKMLWDVDLQGKTIGACFDSYVEYGTSSHKEKIGLRGDQPYFNSGVLLIDMKKWQKRDICLEVGKWIETNKELMRYPDQDVLNALFKDEVLLINNRFNFMPYLSTRIKRGLIDKSLAINYEKVDFPIVIYHYCGVSKPWQEDNTLIKTRHYFSLAKEINIDLYTTNNYLKRGFIFIQRVWKDLISYLRYGIY